MYAVGGMAAGDVKLMAMAGAFLTPHDALWAAFFSLIAGGVCGLLIVLVQGQALQTLGRYWLMLRARAYFPPHAAEVAGKPFPYSVAVLLGTLASVFWLTTTAFWWPICATRWCSNAAAVGLRAMSPAHASCALRSV